MLSLLVMMYLLFIFFQKRQPMREIYAPNFETKAMTKSVEKRLRKNIILALILAPCFSRHFRGFAKSVYIGSYGINFIAFLIICSSF